MKEVKRYQCEVCKGIYSTKSGAEKCEKSHVVLDSIKSVEYLDGLTYPGKIIFKTKDGGEMAINNYTLQYFKTKKAKK